MMRKKRRSVLFIGRFQPFHMGHDKLLRYLVKKYDRIVVGIGSSQFRRTPENPFSAGERKSAIKRVMADYPAGSRNKITFAHLVDHTRNADWVAQVVARFPPGEFAVASANPLVRRLLGGADYELDPSPLFNREKWEGTKIRQEVRRTGAAAGAPPSQPGRPGRGASIPRALGQWMEKRGKKVLIGTKGKK
ncbi:Nicotinamide-nucleotide adenylyltransferase [uncultured archaeon]|nr:Nicotinamide-nucleotide adenylyltransferase [uncultured archaeon]